MKKIIMIIVILGVVVAMTSCKKPNLSCTCSYGTGTDSTWYEELTESWRILDVDDCEDMANWYSIGDTQQSTCH